VPTDLIFDFFGTLVGYTPGLFVDAEYRTTHRVLSEHGFPIAYEDFVAGFTRVCDGLEREAKATHVEFHMHDAGRAFFSSCFDSDAPDTVVERFIATLIAEWNRGTVFYPAIKPFLERLAHRYRLSIISNTHYPSLISRNLDAMGVSEYFAQVVTSAELGIRKPHPRIFRHTLERLGIPPASAVYIGDSFEDDYQGAAGVAMRCILVDPAQRWRGMVEDRVERLFDIERTLVSTARG
jgi:putative hydrolase of the HAD superfamily